MKMVIIEPLGVEEGKLLAMAKESLGDRVEIVYYNTKTTDTAELIERGKDAEIIVVSNLPLNAQVIEGCRNLKLLAVAFTGVDHIAMDVCRKNGVMVCNCAGYSTCAVADLVFGMTFGVVGTGAIGLRVAAIAQAFGCRVLAYSRTAKDVPGVRYVDLETLLAESDVVSLHTPLTEETRGLMNEKRIGLMKKNAVLINTARGPVVDSDALAGALKEGRIAGACIDVFENEPPVRKDHPLFSAPNTIVTPHVAFATKEALVKRAVIVFDNVVNYLDGTPRNVIG